MNRIGPNGLLAVATAFAFLLVIASVTVYGGDQPWWRHIVTAVVVVIAYILLQPLARKLMKTERRPLVSAEAPDAAVWASIYPGILILSSALPMIFPGVSFGLLVVIGAVIFGATIESARAARDGA
ncbi:MULTISPECIES: hypothetical protein [Brevundimonas]|uniref:hypothetical protein n=1 Tax=Brevundimonas TaxID=41275 RepID=UPI000F043655|nr:hypothetical protein [Brevundimonas lutea]